MNVPDNELCLQFQECLGHLKKYLLHTAQSKFGTKMSLTSPKFAPCDAQAEFKTGMVRAENTCRHIFVEISCSQAQKNFGLPS